MYAKFVRFVNGDPVLAGDGGDKVVPRECTIIEAERFNYRKYLGSSLEDIVDKHDLFGETLPFNEPKGTTIEVIHLTATSDDGSSCKQYIAPRQQLYIMNAAGKTIDTLQCLFEQGCTSTDL